MSQKSRKNNKITLKNSSSTPSPFWRKWFPLIIFIAVGVLLFYPPYFMGLFFNKDMFITHIITAVIFITVWVEKIYRKDYHFMDTPLDWATLAYAGAYMLSLIGAVHPGDAMYGFLRILNYFMVYWLVTQVVKNYRDYENIIRILIVAGTGVAVIGILVAVGLLDYPSAFNGNIILSTLQYPNTTAVYLGVLTILGLTLWVKEQNFTWQFIYAVNNYLMILVVLSTLSKGAWLIFVVGLIILLIGLPGVYRWKSLYGMGFMFVAAAIIYIKFFPAIQGKAGTASDLLLVLIGFILILAGQGIWMGLEKVYQRQGLPALTSGLAVLCILGIGSLFFSSGSDSKALLNEIIVTELRGLSDFSSSSWVARTDFTGWGMKIVKDHPIIGIGAGGWNALYHQYQDYLAWTTEVHNHFMQVWVEAGTIGLLAFLVIWIMFIIIGIRVHQNLKKQVNEDHPEVMDKLILAWGAMAGALALGIHAGMDFDLSYPALFFLLCVLLALLSKSGEWEGAWKLNRKHRISVYAENEIAICLAFILLITGVSYLMAYSYGTKGGITLKELNQVSSPEAQTENLRQAIQYFEKASLLDSNNAGYKACLANVYTIVYKGQVEQKIPQAEQLRKRIIQLVGEAERLKPYDTKVRNALINTCMSVDDVEGTIRQGEGLIKANPNDIKAYSAYATVLWAGIDYWDKMGQKEKAQVLVEKVIEIPELVSEQNKRINPDRIQYWAGAPLQLPEDTLALVTKAQQR